MQELPQAWTEEQALCTWEVSATSLSGIRVLLHFFIFYSVIYSYRNLTVYITTDVYNFLDWGNIEGKSVINTDLIQFMGLKTDEGAMENSVETS